MRYKEFQSKLQESIEIIAEKDNKIESQKKHIDALDRQIEVHKSQFESGRRDYQRALILLKQQKEKVDFLSKREYELEYENQKNSVRASVAFRELTPRYPKIEEEFKRFNLKKPIEKIDW